MLGGFCLSRLCAGLVVEHVLLERKGGGEEAVQRV